MAPIDATALDELNSPEARALFDTADKLSSLGVGRIVDLPQIIVVGDQSSGKSSVLEAISHVRFPVEKGVCTKFATELVLRQSTHRSVTATVHFAGGASPTQSIRIDEFDQEDIHGVIEDAKKKMGISGGSGAFSKDILRLEIQGPDMYPLTLVDLPGIFHAGTAMQSAEDKTTVMELVESYMKKPNSIILAIISANYGLASQVVRELATKHDPARVRTLGVITKPDLLPPGSEDEYLEVIQGRNPVYDLALGWHVLRNRADYEANQGSREAIEEQFFKSEPWASLPKPNRGVASLRTKLSGVLLDHIKKGLPVLLENLGDKLSENNLKLSRMGAPRSSPDDMRSFLIGIASSFERLVHDGIQGRYNNPFYGDTGNRDWRLRAQLRNFNKALRYTLLVFGCSQEVSGRPGWKKPPAPRPPGYLFEFMERHKYLHSLDLPKAITWGNLTSWLEKQAASYQGTEFPGFANMDIVMRFFQSQAEPWRLIAETHLQKVLRVTKAFVEAVFEHIVGPFSSNGTTRAILSTLVDDYFEEKEAALAAKLKELLRPYQEGYALPLDADFHEAMDKRVTKPAADAEPTWAPSPSEEKSEFGTERIIDAVETFYDMALRTFTDNVINLAVESCLVQDLPNIFTPKRVSNMNNRELEKLAAESPDVVAARLRLEEDIRLLEEGLKRCRPFRPRASLSDLPSARSVGEVAQKGVPSPKYKSTPSTGGKVPSIFDTLATSLATDGRPNPFTTDKDKQGGGPSNQAKPAALFSSFSQPDKPVSSLPFLHPASGNSAAGSSSSQARSPSSTAVPVSFSSSASKPPSGGLFAAGSLNSSASNGAPQSKGLFSGLSAASPPSSEAGAPASGLFGAGTPQSKGLLGGLSAASPTSSKAAAPTSAGLFGSGAKPGTSSK